MTPRLVLAGILVICVTGTLSDAARASNVLSLNPLGGDVAAYADPSLPATQPAAVDDIDPALTLDAAPPTGQSRLNEESLQTPETSPTALSLDIAATNEATGADAAPTPNKLSLSFELPIWFSGLSGTAGVRGLTAPVNASFLDILRNADSVLGLGGRLEADYGPWIFFIDGLYMKLTKDNVPVGPPRLGASINFVSTLAIADAGLLYQFGKWNLSGKGGGDDPTTISIAGGAAGRYMHVGLSMDTVRGISRNQNQDWADPLAAGQVTLDLNKHWQFLVRGDIGAGDDVKLTWAAGAYASYQFALCSKVSAAVKVGYQAVSEDYETGSGNQRFTWDMIMHGPMLVFELKF